MGYKMKQNDKLEEDFKKSERPIYILAWGDSPACATGFATVMRNIFTPLGKSGKYVIDIIGINDRGEWKDPEKYPYRIYPAKSPLQVYGSDFHGRGKLLVVLSNKDIDLKLPWDIVFLLNDPFVLEAEIEVFKQSTAVVIKNLQDTYKKKLPPEVHFKTVAYWPVDSDIPGNWVEKAIAPVDYNVAYTEFGKNEIIKGDVGLVVPTGVSNNLRVIYHGYNAKEFYPVTPEVRTDFRKQFFEGKVDENVFLVSIVARNQMRKDIPRSMKIFKEFQKRRPNSFLYIHAQETDAWGSLKEYARKNNLELGKDWGYPRDFSSNTGFPVEALNLLYNASDCVLSTSLGEGFGFYNFECMATKTLILAPNNTVHPELFGYLPKEDISDPEVLYKKVRGMPIICGSNMTEWATYGPEDMHRTRPLTNVEDAIKKLIWVYDNPDKVKEIKERAYTWVRQYTWDRVVDSWDRLFQEIFNKLQMETYNYLHL